MPSNGERMPIRVSLHQLLNLGKTAGQAARILPRAASRVRRRFPILWFASGN